jgi:hypothetical protein
LQRFKSYKEFESPKSEKKSNNETERRAQKRTFTRELFAQFIVIKGDECAVTISRRDSEIRTIW